jgi:hypothetical protein
MERHNKTRPVPFVTRFSTIQPDPTIHIIAGFLPTAYNFLFYCSVRHLPQYHGGFSFPPLLLWIPGEIPDD